MIDVINEYESRLKYIATIKDKTLKIKTVIRLFSFFTNLVAYCAGSFAGRLAGSLAFAAATSF